MNDNRTRRLNVGCSLGSERLLGVAMSDQRKPHGIAGINCGNQFMVGSLARRDERLLGDEEGQQRVTG